MFAQPRATFWGRLSDYQRDEILLQIVEQLDDMNRRLEKFEVKVRRPAFKSVGTKHRENSQGSKKAKNKISVQHTAGLLKDDVEIKEEDRDIVEIKEEDCDISEIKEEDRDIVCLSQKDEAKGKVETEISSLPSTCANELQNLVACPLSPPMEFIGIEQLKNFKVVDSKELVNVESWMETGTDDSIYVFTDHTSEVRTVASSPTDVLLVAAGGGNEKGFLWKIGHGDWIQQLPGCARMISTSAFSSTGQLLVSTGFDGFLQILDTSSSNLGCFLEGLGEAIEWVKCHPSRHMVLASSKDSTIWMWNTGKNTYMNVFPGNGNKVICADFTLDGKMVCTSVEDASLRICPTTCDGNKVEWMQASWILILRHFKTRGRVYSNMGRMMQTRKRPWENNKWKQPVHVYNRRNQKP